MSRAKRQEGKELRRRRKCRWESSEAEGGGGRETVVSAVPFRDRERRRVHAMNASFCRLESKAHSGAAAAPLFRSPLDIVVVRCDGPSFVRRTRNDGRRPRDAWLFCCSLSVLFDPFVRPSQTMNLLRLSGANEPQSGVGLKFIFCAQSGLASGRGHRRPSVAFC